MAFPGVKFLIASVLSLFIFSKVVFCANNILQLDICRETPANNSKPFCSCKDKVISCDFSSFTNNEVYEIQLNGWNDNLNGNIKRLCFCGGPRNLHLMFTPNILNGLRQLHRVDLYNIPGVVHTRRAFAEYFSGDLYISKVRITRIHPNSFAGGDAFTIQDVSGLECCSKIKPPLKHLNHPVFFMEDSKLLLVETNGIHNDHKWKTFIWRNVSIGEIDPYGVTLETPEMNVSITNCTFSHTKENAVMIKGAANVLLSLNNFKNSSHFYALQSRSSYPNSNLVLLENFFNNGFVFNVDARKVLGLFNHFNLWDNFTFYHINHTQFNDRKYLMSLNSIVKVEHFDSMAIPPGPQNEIRYFFENILGHCHCEDSTVAIPSVLQDTRCEYKDSRAICNPRIEKAVQTCQSRGNVYRADCDTEETALSSVPWDYMRLLNDFLRKHESALNSPFIEEMLKFSKHRLQVPLMDQYEPSSQVGGKNSAFSIQASFFDRLFLFVILCLLKVLAK